MTGRQAAALAIGAAVLAPSRLLQRAPTICTFRRMTGRPCPTCGMTRSWNALARGHVRDSVGYHPLGPVALAVASLAVVAPNALNRPAFHSPMVIVPVAAAWLATWAIRFVRRR
jgi:hypothetical protein